MKPSDFLPSAPRNDLVEPDERSSANEQDVGGVDRGEFLVRMLAPALWRNVGDCPFENLQQRLLHAFARNIASDGWVLVLASDLVDFVDIDDAGLGAAHVAIGCLQQLQE